MKSYQHILFELLGSYPSHLFTEFFSDKINKQYWNPARTIQPDSFNFGTDELQYRFGIYHEGLHVFKFYLPKHDHLPKEQILQDFEDFLMKRNYDVFIYRTEYLLDQEKEGTMVDCIKPLGIHTKKLYKWLKELEEIDDLAFTYEFNLDVNGTRNEYIELRMENGSLGVYLKGKHMISIRTDEEFQSFKQSMRVLSSCKEKVKKRLDENIEKVMPNVRGPNTFRKVLNAHYYRIFQTSIHKNEKNQWEYIFLLKGEPHYFSSLDEIEEKFPEEEVQKIVKGLKIKALFNA
jgi:hypothetical protein